MKKLAIIPVHGMGETQDDYHEDLMDGLIDRIGLVDWTKHIHYDPVFYQDTLQGNQSKIWQEMNEYVLESTRLRRLMLFGFSDAGTLEYSAHHGQEEYIAVQQRIYDSFARSFAAGGNTMIPVIVIAQSLGCQVMSNYIWDSQHKKGLFKTTGNGQSNADKFTRLATCRHFVTTGCNIPMFVAGLKDIQCFKKPNPQFQWDNYFDSDDFLGWPISPLSKSHRDLGVRDHHINAGGFITSQTWFSHTKYWTDKDVLKPLERFILSQLAP